MKSWTPPVTRMMQTTFQAPGPSPRPASHRRSEIAVSGMTCNNCARHVTEAIQSVPGVESAAVSLQDKNAIVRWNAGATSDITAVIHAIELAGFKAKAIDPEPDSATLAKPARRESIWSNSVFIGVIPPRF